MIGKTALAGTVALILGTAAAAQQAPAAPPAVEAQSGIPDTSGSGPYPAVMEVDPALPDHVIYRPADLAAVGQGKLGVFIWGNGACADDGASARLHLSEIASHGYLAIAPGKWRNGPNAKEPPAPARAPAADGSFLPPTSAADLKEALDWALAEDGREGSRYAGMIDEGAVATGGFSCGGVQALQLAGDPRLKTVVVQNSGIFNDDTVHIAGMELRKSALQALHTPVIYVLGGPSDIAYANGMDDFARIDHVPAAMVNLLGKGHGGTYFEPSGGKAAQIVVDWLEWQLRGDTEAARSFLGEDCGLCSDPEVEIERKNLR
jgi:dienelactone hydrolase